MNNINGNIDSDQCVSDDTTSEEDIISFENPGDDYRKFFDENVQNADIDNDELIEANFKQLAAATRDAVWTLLFSEPPIENNLWKAADLLEEHKADACFYAPYDYNDWIVHVRDELIKRGMLGFWKNNIVARELGLCCARDCDFFDNINDPDPIEFYNHGGCKAPFPDERNDAVTATTEHEQEPTVSIKIPESISDKEPEQDYRKMLKTAAEYYSIDKEKIFEVFDKVQKAIWHFLFDYTDKLTHSNYEKAARLLEAYKKDACFYYPYKYNEWIPLVRDEIFKRKDVHLDFWKEVIVPRKLGLCWYKDSEFFDDANDTKPIDFYKYDDNLK